MKEIRNYVSKKRKKEKTPIFRAKEKSKRLQGNCYHMKTRIMYSENEGFW